MFDAGSAVFTLTGRVVKTPFEDYGKLIDQARLNKEHAIVLGAKTEDTGFKTFRGNLDSVQKKLDEFRVQAGDQFAKVSGYITKMADDSARGLGVFRKELTGTAQSFGLVDEAAKTTATVVTDESRRMRTTYEENARAAKVSADEQVRANERIVESERAAAGGGGGRGYVNPVGGGGGGGGGDPQHRIDTANKSMKEGFNTLSNLGKWTTLAIGAVGVVTVKWAADFQRQMTLVHTQAGYTEKDVQRLNKAVLDLAPSVGFGPTKLAEALFHIASSGIPASKAMGILKIAAEGAKVGNAGLEETTNALVAVMRTAPKDVHSAGEAMGVMNDIVGKGNLRMEDLTKALSTGVLPAAKGVGLSLRDLGAALDVLTSRGVPAEQAATRLRTTLNLIANPTAKAQKALQELGMSQSQLAADMRQHGLGYALQDLENHLNKAFPPGGHLSVSQERQALTQYGESLQATGVKGAALEKDLLAFKHRMDETGGSAIKQGQVIADAFGGARMGTTMITLMQNIDDVRKHEEGLNKSGAAQRFQQAWKDTQKDFSVQVSQMVAALQKWGIQLGDFLIPKLKALVTALIDVGKWLGRHKVIADALAITFGTLLTAAVVAFFGKLIFNAGKSLVEIGKFGKYLSYDLPQKIMAGDTKVQQVLKGWINRLRGVQEEAAATGDEMAATGEKGAVTGVGGGAGGVEGALTGMIEGMITGVRGTTAPGSAENPLAVVIMASETVGLGSRGAASAEKTATAAEAEASQAEAAAGSTAAVGAAPAEAAAQEAAMTGEVGATGFLARAGGAASGAMRFIGGAMLPGAIGLGVGSMAQGALGLRGGTAGTLGGGVAGGAIGMALLGPLGAGIGAALGSSLGPTIGHALGSLFGGGPSAGQRAAQGVTRGITGSIAAPITGQARSVADVRSAIQRNIDQANQHLQPISVGWRMQPLSKQQTDAARNNLEQAGKLAGQAFITGYQEHVKDVSGASLVSDFEHKMKVLPKSMGGIAKDAAASQMLEYAAGLEANKKLPKGETQKIIRELESYYPGLRKYLRDNAESTDAELATVFRLQQTRSSLQGSIKYMETQFGYIPKNSKVTMDNMTQQFQSGLSYLSRVIRTSTGQQRDDALAAYKQLQQQFNGYLKQMETRTQQHMTNIQSELKSGSQTAVNQTVPYWNQYTSIIGSAEAAGVITIQQGNKMIAGEMDKALQALGFTGHQARNLAKAGYTVQDISNLQHGARGSALAAAQRTATHHATGGFLPGSEFGRGDVMTLVDPQGKPRAKMAGDEAIFNRWQMPYVEAGLQSIGLQGSNELWQKVNTPHGAGYERGGLLPGFFRGGHIGANGPYSQYALPIPLKYLRNTGSWSPDQGIDVPLPAHTPEYAVGPGVIVQEGIQGFGPWAPILRVLAGPLAGDEFYYGHAGPNFAHKGQHVAAGQAITQVGAGRVGISTGPHIEFGFWPPRGGAAVASFLRALLSGAGVTQFGGSGALGGTWTDLKPPHVAAGGDVAKQAQRVLNQVTNAANRFGQSQAGSAGLTGAGWSGGGNNVQNEQLGRKMMLAAGWGANQWPYLQKLWTKESNWQTHIANSSSGAYGIPQALPADKMASAGNDWRNNPATQIAWGLNYIKGRYGSPQNAWAHETANNWYGTGGYMSYHAQGKRPWSPLPSSLGRLPGFRPPRLRRGASGIHTVGTRTSTGRTGGSRGRTRAGGRGGARSQARPKQTLSRPVANTLSALGFGNFVDDQNALGRLDAQYTDQQNLFSLYDSTGMSQQDLDVLMGIKENEWDILYREFTTLPDAITKLQNRVNKDEGSTGSPGHFVTVKGQHKGQHKGQQHKGQQKKGQRGTSSGHLRWVPPTMPSGVEGLTKEVADTESDITALRAQTTAASHQITRVHHGVSQEIMNLADQYASESAKFLNYIDAAHNRMYRNSQSRIQIHSQMRALARSKSSGPDLNTIVSIIMSNTPLPTSTALSHNPQYQRLQDDIAKLQTQDLTLRQNSYTARQQLHSLLMAREADARKYRQAGFDAAWATTLKKWKIQAKITQLEATLKRLKASLKAETAKLKEDQNALQTLQDWESGGLQGTEAISSSLESAIYDILGLYQQGADLPTPGNDYYGRSRAQVGPTLSLLEKVLTDKPPKGLGMTLPSGLAQGTQAAAQAAAEFASFQASRAALFAQFGSNFSPAAVGVGSSTAAIGAGPQFFGAAAGPEAGLGAPGGTSPGFARGGRLGESGPGPGGTTINIENHFAAGPPDPHTWSAGVTHELNAMG